jgi:membrane-associated progesterone receptor component
MTAEELQQHDGTNADLPIYVAIKGVVFDVSPKRDIYGPGGSYHVFAGRDATRVCFVTLLMVGAGQELP